MLKDCLDCGNEFNSFLGIRNICKNCRLGIKPGSKLRQQYPYRDYSRPKLTTTDSSYSSQDSFVPGYILGSALSDDSTPSHHSHHDSSSHSDTSSSYDSSSTSYDSSSSYDAGSSYDGGGGGDYGGSSGGD